MGPGCFHPRNILAMLEVDSFPFASMGPGCFHPRNTSHCSRHSAAGIWLQWGRDVSIPEMERSGHERLLLLRASMGPGCFHPRNMQIAESFTSCLCMLQWGRDVSIPEIASVETPALAATVLQWGRDVSIPEMGAAPNVSGEKRTLQWGRDVSIPEMRRRTPGQYYCSGFNGAGMFPSQK